MCWFLHACGASAGMDPSARATAWAALSRLDCPCVIIATVRVPRCCCCALCCYFFRSCLQESLEECKALCTRMCVMVDGRFEAIGSVNSLRSRSVSHTLSLYLHHPHSSRHSLYFPLRCPLRFGNSFLLDLSVTPPIDLNRQCIAKLHTSGLCRRDLVNVRLSCDHLQGTFRHVHSCCVIVSQFDADTRTKIVFNSTPAAGSCGVCLSYAPISVCYACRVTCCSPLSTIREVGQRTCPSETFQDSRQ